MPGPGAHLSQAMPDLPCGLCVPAPPSAQHEALYTVEAVDGGAAQKETSRDQPSCAGVMGHTVALGDPCPHHMSRGRGCWGRMGLLLAGTGCASVGSADNSAYLSHTHPVPASSTLPSAGHLKRCPFPFSDILAQPFAEPLRTRPPVTSSLALPSFCCFGVSPHLTWTWTRVCTEMPHPA